MCRFCFPLLLWERVQSFNAPKPLYTRSAILVLVQFFVHIFEGLNFAFGGALVHNIFRWGSASKYWGSLTRKLAFVEWGPFLCCYLLVYKSWHYTEK